MNAEALAAFYERAGFDVRRTPHALWQAAPGRRLYRSLPIDRPVRPDASDEERIFRHGAALGIEFTTEPGRGAASSHFVVRDPGYGLHSLKRQFRQHVRRGLERCVVREIDFGDLERHGAAANRASLARQARAVPHLLDPRLWRRYCDAGRRTPGAGVLASFTDGILAAYLVFFRVDDVVHGLQMMSRTDLWAHRPNHLLYYSFAHAMIRRWGVQAVSVGLGSLPPAPERDRFKRAAGFAAEPCAIGIRLRPWAHRFARVRAPDWALGAAARLLGTRVGAARARSILTAARATADR